MMFALNPYFERTFFNDPFFFTSGEQRALRPSFRTDIKDTADAFVIEAELPGFKKEELKIELQKDLLTVSAEKTESKEEESKEENRFLRKERFIGTFKRSFTLSGIEQDAITASFEDGLLTLTLPKKEKKEEAVRQIAIA